MLDAAPSCTQIEYFSHLVPLLIATSRHSAENCGVERFGQSAGAVAQSNLARVRIRQHVLGVFHDRAGS
ncbi:hypothetical protein B0H19DRAFT_1194294 [Mycena capillaripes]|nr:hypothetical protein B0H19DRAFT_1194294 [Mycena capillaripes]